MLRTLARIAVLVSAVSLTGCGDDPPTGTTTPVLTTISVTSAADKTTIMLGETLQLTAAGKDQKGAAIDIPNLAWTSSATSVATVSNAGVVTAIGGGQATITATSGTVTANFNVTVQGSIHSQNVTTSQTWRAADSPHLVTTSISVTGAGAPVLTIEAGSTVRFASGASLTLGGAAAGSIIASGTAAAPITMQADASTPAKGSWMGLLFSTNAGPSQLRFVTMTHCGGGNTSFPACIYMEGANVKPVLANVTINNSGGHGVVARNGAGFGAGSATLTVTNANQYPVHIGPNEAGSIPTGGTFTGNTNNSVFLNNARVETTQTWPNLGIPYVASVDVIVEATGGPVLTLQPGTEIRHEAGRAFSIGTCGAGGPGTLIAVGTAAQPIKFTSNAASPTAGTWDGIYLGCTATASTRIEHAIVEYGGEGSLYAAYTGNILVEQDIGAVVKNTVIRHSKDCGIIRRSPLITWTTDFTAAAHGNTLTNNVRTQCGG